MSERNAYLNFMGIATILSMLFSKYLWEIFLSCLGLAVTISLIEYILVDRKRIDNEIVRGEDRVMRELREAMERQARRRKKHGA